MMFTRYITAFIVSAAAVVAQGTVTVNTPLGVLACTNQVVTWTGGTAPYILTIQPGGDVSAAALETFTGITGMSYTWHVIEQANTQVFLRIHDANGNSNESGTFTIQSAGSSVCSGTTGGTSVVGTATAPAAGTTTPAAGATTPAAGATTPAAGNTTPAAGNTTPAASGSSSAAHSTTTTSHNGASSLQVAGGLVGLVGAVAVALA